MKMGNIASPWRYDVAPCIAPQFVRCDTTAELDWTC
jgi:hypothetical protein